MSRSTFNRRCFLKATATLPAAGTITPYWFTGANALANGTKSKNDRPHVGAIGCGGRGTAIMKQAAQFGEVVAVCDVDSKNVERAKAHFGGKPDLYSDYRKLLERNDIDVITNGTPDHWHTAVNVAACKSGKDVYTEKPLTLTIDEGKILCKVVKQTGRIVQVGTQQRAVKCFQTAVELVRNGRLGKLKHVEVILPLWSTKGGPFPKQPVPPNLNWDMYQGQAPEHDYCPQRTHFNFRWWFEYAGGIICDWGQHFIDIAHWGMDMEHSGPLTIEGTAVFPNNGMPDCYNNPDKFAVNMTYPGGIPLFYHVTIDKKTERNGIKFTGEKGRIHVNRGGVYGKPADELKDNPLPEDAWKAYPNNDHMGNFFECVKTRKQPVSPVGIGHRTITACHLGNIAVQLKRKINWNPVAQQIIGDDEADAWQKRAQRKPYVIG